MILMDAVTTTMTSYDLDRCTATVRQGIILCNSERRWIKQPKQLMGLASTLT